MLLLCKYPEGRQQQAKQSIFTLFNCTKKHQFDCNSLAIASQFTEEEKRTKKRIKFKVSTRCIYFTRAAYVEIETQPWQVLY